MKAGAPRHARRPDHNVQLRGQIAALEHRHEGYGVGMIRLKQRQKGPSLNMIATPALSHPAVP